MKIYPCLFLLILPLFSVGIYSMEDQSTTQVSLLDQVASPSIGDLPLDIMKSIFDRLIRDIMKGEIEKNKGLIDELMKDAIFHNIYEASYADLRVNLISYIGFKKAVRNVVNFLSTTKQCYARGLLSNSDFIAWLIERCAYHASELLPVDDRYYVVRFATQIGNGAAREYLTKLIATDAKAKKMAERLLFQCAGIAREKSDEECKEAARYIKFLAEAGINVNTPNRLQQIPLVKAVIGKHKNIIEALLDAGADIDRVDSKGEGSTPLMRACQSRHGKEIIELLIGRGARVNTLVENYSCALYYAIIHAFQSNGQDEALTYVRMLLEAGADPNLILKADGKTNTILTMASRLTDKSIAALLIKYGAVGSAEPYEFVAKLELC